MNEAVPASGNAFPALGIVGCNSAMAVDDGLRACVDAWATWQQEVARFFDARWDENRRAWTEILSARDLDKIMKIQEAWRARAAADYTDEAARLLKLVTCVSLTGTTPAVQGTAMLVA